MLKIRDIGGKRKAQELYAAVQSVSFNKLSYTLSGPPGLNKAIIYAVYDPSDFNTTWYLFTFGSAATLGFDTVENVVVIGG